jgi:hypothetical protein
MIPDLFDWTDLDMDVDVDVAPVKLLRLPVSMEVRLVERLVLVFALASIWIHDGMPAAN